MSTSDIFCKPGKNVGTVIPFNNIIIIIIIIIIISTTLLSLKLQDLQIGSFMASTRQRSFLDTWKKQIINTVFVTKCVGTTRREAAMPGGVDVKGPCQRGPGPSRESQGLLSTLLLLPTQQLTVSVPTDGARPRTQKRAERPCRHRGVAHEGSAFLLPSQYEDHGTARMLCFATATAERSHSATSDVRIQAAQESLSETRKNLKRLSEALLKD
ncbi:uncharacterized protein RHO17_000109 [Thomomys bottae]